MAVSGPVRNGSFITGNALYVLRAAPWQALMRRLRPRIFYMYWAEPAFPSLFYQERTLVRERSEYSCLWKH